MDHLCNKFVKDKNTFQAQRQPTFIWNEKRLPMNRLSASVPSCIQKYEQVELLERKPGRLHMTGHQYIFIAGQGGWYQRRVHYRLHDDGPMQWYWKKKTKKMLRLFPNLLHHQKLFSGGERQNLQCMNSGLTINVNVKLSDYWIVDMFIRRFQF